MASRLSRLALTAALAAGTIGGCASSHSFNSSKHNADTTLQNYFAMGGSQLPRYENPSPESYGLIESDSHANLEDQYKAYQNGDMIALDINHPAPLVESYDPYTGEYNIDRPSEGKVISYFFNRAVDLYTDKQNPIRVTRDGVDRASKGLKNWFYDKTGGEISESGLGFIINWNW